MSFIHLNVASGYSLKYGTTHPHDLVQRAAEFEMPALALTDRDGLAGAIRFTQSCVDYGIAPIIGVNCAIDLGGAVKVASPCWHIVMGDGARCAD
jgi:error-prone DNA polymerase